jgi:hypothetical protein
MDACLGQFLLLKPGWMDLWMDVYVICNFLLLLRMEAWVNSCSSFLNGWRLW